MHRNLSLCSSIDSKRARGEENAKQTLDARARKHAKNTHTEKKKKKTKKKRTQRARFLLFSLSLSLSFERAPRLFKRPAASKENREEGERQKTPSFERERPNNEKGACFCPKTSQTLNNTAHKKKEKKEFNSPERFFIHFCTFLQVKMW